MTPHMLFAPQNSSGKIPFIPETNIKTRAPLIPKYFLRYSPELNLLRFTGPSLPAEIPICSGSEGAIKNEQRIWNREKRNWEGTR